MNREGNKVMTMMKERMTTVDAEVAVREDERLADKAKLEALSKEIAQLQAKLMEVTGKREENIEMVIDKVDVTSEEDKIKVASLQDTVLVPAMPEMMPIEAEMEEVAVTETGRDEAPHRGHKRLPGNMRGGESRNGSRSASKTGQKPTLDFDPNELLTQTMTAILKVPSMSVTDAFVAATNVVEAKSKEIKGTKAGNAKSKPKSASFAEAARQGPAFDLETVLGRMQVVGQTVNNNVEAIKHRQANDHEGGGGNGSVGSAWGVAPLKKKDVIRPTTWGTRVSELHLSVPDSTTTDKLKPLFGKNLQEAAATAIDLHLMAEDKWLFADNLINGVRWAQRGNLIIMCAHGITDLMKIALHKAVAGWSPANSQHSVLILNKLPSTELKFTSILSRHSDGSVITAQEFKNQIALHHQWQDVEFWGRGPSLLKRKDEPIPEASILVVSVVDDEKGSVGRRLMNTKVDFWGESRFCRRWIQKNHVPRCTICQRWGHTTLACYTGDRKCLKCGEAHAVQQHEQNCETCKKGKGSVCAPKCTNCNGPHFADSNDCPFWQARYSRNDIEALYTKLKKERMEATKDGQKTECEECYD